MSRLSALHRRFCLLGLFILLLLPQAVRAAQPPVYVILWFDTEDYILPADDDADLHLANFLTQENVKGTFKIVGEKARELEPPRPNRRDRSAEETRDRLPLEFS